MRRHDTIQVIRELDVPGQVRYPMLRDRGCHNKEVGYGDDLHVDATTDRRARASTRLTFTALQVVVGIRGDLPMNHRQPCDRAA
jgi:hypothetical protein